MGSQAVHPAASDRTTEASSLDRVADRLFRASFLGFVGFLGFLGDVFWAFEYAIWFFLFFLLYLVSAVVWIGRWLQRSLFGSSKDDASEDADPIDWIEHGYRLGAVEGTVAAIVGILQPLVLLQALLQNVGNAVVYLRYLGSPPDPDSYESSVDYRLPFDGSWTVLNGSPDRRFSHSWSILQQRYAYDFVVTDEDGTTHDGGTRPENHYCFDEPLLAPADCTVVAVRSSHRDYHRTTGWVDPLQYDLHGNVVLLEHADGEYSILAHLKEGSVTVSEGERVERGEQIATCGHSGNSSEPHLHFSLLDRPNGFTGASLPVQFTDVTIRDVDGTADSFDRTYVHCGQVVEHDGPQQ